MSSHNSNDSMVVINPEDLEESPPPEEVTIEDNSEEEGTPGDETADKSLLRSMEQKLSDHKMKLSEEVVEGFGDREGDDENVVLDGKAVEEVEQVGEITEVEEKIETVELDKTEEQIEVKAEEEDDPPIEILEAPSVDSVAPVTEAASAASIVEPMKEELADDPPIEVLEAPSVASVAPVIEAPPSAPITAPVKEEPADDPSIEILEAPKAVPEPVPVPVAPKPDPPKESSVQIIRPSSSKPSATLEEVDDDDEEDDEDIDETVMERLVGLTEMFPDFVTAGSVALVKGSWSLTTKMYSMTRSVSWVVFSSATILFMPVMIETERLQIQDQQKAAKNQILLGPGAAVSGGPSLGPPPI